MLSKSFLFDFARSPWAWKRDHDKGIKKEVTPAMEWGSAVDCLATTPQLYASTVQFVDAANWQSNAAKAERQRIRAEGKVPMLEKDRPRIREAADILAAHLERHGLDTAKTQACATVNVAVDGRPYTIKCLADFWMPDRPALADLKTTNSIEAADLARTIRGFGYHWQAALYLDAFRANHPEEIPEEFDLHFQEATEPFLTRVWRLTEKDIAAGRREYMQAIRLWDRCITLDEWPGQELEPIEGRHAIYE
jgi:hypothetical protein